jgi:hypothetical protein
MSFSHRLLLLSSYTRFVGIAINGLHMFALSVGTAIPATGK